MAIEQRHVHILIGLSIHTHESYTSTQLGVVRNAAVVILSSAPRKELSINNHILANFHTHIQSYTKHTVMNYVQSISYVFRKDSKTRSSLYGQEERNIGRVYQSIIPA